MRTETLALDSNALELHIESHGDGPCLILAHGFGGSARNFRPQIRALRDRYRVIVYDARGHARSGASESAADYTGDALCQDLGRVLDAAGVERAVVGGLSMGAAVALRFAARHPDRVRGVVLASPPPSGRDPAWAHDFARTIDSEGLDAAGAIYVWGERSGQDWEGTPGLDPEAAKWVRQGFLEHTPHAMAHILREFLSSLPTPDAPFPPLKDIDCPVLIVAGSNDRLSLREGEALHALLPKSRMEVIEGAGHVVNLAAPAETNRILAEFMDAL